LIEGNQIHYHHFCSCDFASKEKNNEIIKGVKNVKREVKYLQCEVVAATPCLAVARVVVDAVAERTRIVQDLHRVGVGGVESEE
jgi:hypothetical protein